MSDVLSRRQFIAAVVNNHQSLLDKHDAAQRTRLEEQTRRAEAAEKINAKHVLSSIDIQGQYADLREAVKMLRETLADVVLLAPGYDWNTDPLSLTLKTGAAYQKADAILAGVPDDENDSLAEQVADLTDQLKEQTTRAGKAEDECDSLRASCHTFEQQIADLTAKLASAEQEQVRVALERNRIERMWLETQEQLAAMTQERDVALDNLEITGRDWNDLREQLTAAQTEAGRLRSIIKELVEWNEAFHTDYAQLKEICHKSKQALTPTVTPCQEVRNDPTH